MEQRRAKKNWTNELLLEKEQGRKLYLRFFLYKNSISKSTWICISYMGCLHSIVSFHCHATSEWHSFQLSVMDTSGSFFWLRVESYILSYSLLDFHHNLISSRMLILSSHKVNQNFCENSIYRIFVYKV